MRPHASIECHGYTPVLNATATRQFCNSIDQSHAILRPFVLKAMALQDKLDTAWHLIMQRMLENEIRLSSGSSEQVAISNIPPSEFPMLEDA